MKKILSIAIAGLLVLGISSSYALRIPETEIKTDAEIRVNREKAEVRQETRTANRDDRYEEAEYRYLGYEDSNKEKANIYIGTTGNVDMDARIKALRENYIAKIKALQSQYINELKALVGSSTLTVKADMKILPDQASATATAAVNKEKPNQSFWFKIKTWLGLDR